MTNTNSDDLLTRKEAAKILGCDAQTVDVYRRKGLLPWFRRGTRGIRIRRGDVDALTVAQTKVTEG
jgi:excisionase family DNA binding protein